MGSVADQPSRVHRSPAVRRRPAVSGPPATPQDVSGLTVSGVLARHRPTELCSAGRAPQSLLGGPLVVRRASLPRGSRRCLQTRGGGRPRASWTWSGEVDTISRVKAIYRVGQIVLLTGEMAVMRSWIRPLLAGTVLVAASCTASQHESPPSLGEIRIGLLAPLSGEAKAAGTDAVHGAQLAAAMLNGEDGTQLRETRIGVPGLQGSAVRIIPADTRNKPDPAVVEAVHLVDKADVAGLVGAYDPDVTAAASQRTERLGIPFVNGDASAGSSARGRPTVGSARPSSRPSGSGRQRAAPPSGSASSTPTTPLATRSPPRPRRSRARVATRWSRRVPPASLRGRARTLAQPSSRSAPPGPTRSSWSPTRPSTPRRSCGRSPRPASCPRGSSPSAPASGSRRRCRRSPRAAPACSAAPRGRARSEERRVGK